MVLPGSLMVSGQVKGRAIGQVGDPLLRRVGGFDDCVMLPRASYWYRVVFPSHQPAFLDIIVVVAVGGDAIGRGRAVDLGDLPHAADIDEVVGGVLAQGIGDGGRPGASWRRS